jgi:hypothetical protein
MVCATNEHLQLVSTLQPVIFNSSKTSEKSLLLFNQQQFLQSTQQAALNSTIQNTINNSSIIASTLYGELLQVRRDRYLPYQPYIPPTMPPSLIQFQMATANAGVPHSFFTCADSKGVQFVTT